ncbi:MAG: amino acid transporter [Planctomycetes bacterium]|nr:amino acid transporter [Planctomycetota bacterium]
MSDALKPKQPSEHFWLWVMCLLGLDYFSTLAYQPSITAEVAGRLGPIATAVVVLATLLGALPVYCYLAGRSPTGAGSIGMLERVVRGWKGKTLVLLLLGFAATDFTMLKTLSLADAAVHVIKNEEGGWQSTLKDWTEQLRSHGSDHLGPTFAAYLDDQLTVTLILGVVGFVFWFVLRNGFNRNVLVLAVPLVAIFLVLNGLLLGGGIVYLVQHPYIWHDWLEKVGSGDWLIQPPFWAGHGWGTVLLLSMLFLPKLALGLSGFEMSMIIMPQVRGKPGEDPPRTRIRNTRKVLVSAALIMAVYLLTSSVVTGLLIPRSEMLEGGRAANRALAYLAHGGDLTFGAEPILPWCGPLFGSIYDLTTVLVLSLAGTSVMTALAVLLPQFLLRFGMELKWAHRWGVLLMLFALINLIVTLYFKASVDAQRNAYASGVLVLMSCACVVTVLDKRQLRAELKDPSLRRRLNVGYFWLIAGVFVATTLAVAIHSGGGFMIAGCFIAVLLGTSIVSRALRVDEVRTIGFEFKDDHSKLLWDTLRMADFPVLVPHRPGKHERENKEAQIRRDHQLAPDADIVFLEVEVDDPSNFFQNLLIEATADDHCFVIRVTRCTSVAHAIASIALEMSRYSKPPGLHFGWSEMDLLSASWSYMAFGEGNIPWKVRELILRAEPDPEKRPRVIIG